MGGDLSESGFPRTLGRHRVRCYRSFGFVSVENIVFMNELGPESFLRRALYATPAHVLFSCMWAIPWDWLASSAEVSC